MRLEPGWCLVLGASSGFGAAAARALAEAGLDVLGVHLDRRATLSRAEAVQKSVEAAGRRVRLFNVNAADATAREGVVQALREEIGEGPGIRVLLHSLAFGTLRPLVPQEGTPGATPAQLAATLEVMATSLVHWTQALVKEQLFERGGRVFAMTSEGGGRVWPHYGPVGAAKGALESLVRQLAVELAPLEIAVNALCAGVTETPALAKIPGSERLLARARERNPRGRLTTPEDVAGALVALSLPGCGWITGNVIRVDGGEGIAG